MQIYNKNLLIITLCLLNKYQFVFTIDSKQRKNKKKKQEKRKKKNGNL